MNRSKPTRSFISNFSYESLSEKEESQKRSVQSVPDESSIKHTPHPHRAFIDDLRHIAEKIARSCNEATKPLATELLRRLKIRVQHDDAWQRSLEMLHRRHPGFLEALSVYCPTLTQRERQVCALTRLDMSTAAIAEVLGTGRKNVENRRNSIRRKLQLPSNSTSLRSFLESL